MSFEESLGEIRQQDLRRRERERQAADQRRAENAGLLEGAAAMARDAAEYLAKHGVKPTRGFVTMSGGIHSAAEGAEFKNGWPITRLLVLQADGSLSYMHRVKRRGYGFRYAFEPVSESHVVRVPRLFGRDHELEHEVLVGFYRNNRDEIAVWEMDSERDLPLGPLLATLARQLTGETG